MSNKGQKGFAHLILLLLLLVGIGIGVYFVTSGRFILFPKASGENVVFVDKLGRPIPETSSATVLVKLTDVSWNNSGIPVPASVFPSISVSPGDESLTPSTNATIQAGDKNLVTISGRFINDQGLSVPGVYITSNCVNVPIKQSGNSFTFQVKKGQVFCLRSNDLQGLQKKAVNSRIRPLPKNYEYQMAGIDCSKIANPCYKNANFRTKDLPADNRFDFVYRSTATPTPVPTYSPTPVPVTQKVIFAEDPNFLTITKAIPFTSEPVEYTFTNSSYGKKLLYVKFIANTGAEQKATPFPAVIELKTCPVSGPCT